MIVRESQASYSSIDACWYALTASAARFFRLGETLQQGTYLGESPFGATPLWTKEAAKVEGVQFDLSSETVFVALVAEELAVRDCLRPC